MGVDLMIKDNGKVRIKYTDTYMPGVRVKVVVRDKGDDTTAALYFREVRTGRYLPQRVLMLDVDLTDAEIVQALTDHDEFAAKYVIPADQYESFLADSTIPEVSDVLNVKGRPPAWYMYLDVGEDDLTIGKYFHYWETVYGSNGASGSTVNCIVESVELVTVPDAP